MFFRIYESSQLVSLSEDTLSSEKSSTSNLNSEKLDNTEINLTYQSNSRSINNASLNSLSEISKLRLRNVNRVLIGNLNINSIRNKFDQLKDTVLKYIDILILTETKLDETFLTSQFLMDGFSKPYRFDRNKYGGGVMIYIRDTIPSKILEKHSCPNNIECLFIELNFRKCSGYFVERIIRHLKMMNIILIILIKPLTLTATTKRFYLLKISTQK